MHHYDAVLAGGQAASGAMGEAVRRSQPTAAWDWDLGGAGNPPGPARERGIRTAMAALGVALLRGRA